jgi:hypothetical protein
MVGVVLASVGQKLLKSKKLLINYKFLQVFSSDQLWVFNAMIEKI